jgi:hypothetical protein
MFCIVEVSLFNVDVLHSGGASQSCIAEVSMFCKVEVPRSSVDVLHSGGASLYSVDVLHS